LWLSPILTGERPPPSDGFTFTSIDDHRAVLFGGILHDRRYINYVYVIDFRKMVNQLYLHNIKLLRLRTTVCRDN
jgi:hypothetical protein